MNIETTTITKVEDIFLVENVEDMIIRVEARQVQDILENVSDAEEEEIVVLLATIKKNRISTTLSKGRAYRKVDNEVATKAIIKLLNYIVIDTLISIFEEIKYYQIKEILEADNPIKMFEEYV